MWYRCRDVDGFGLLRLTSDGEEVDDSASDYGLELCTTRAYEKEEG